MNQIAVILTGGKQYIVKQGDELKVEKLLDEVGKTVMFDALLTTSINGDDVKVGTPNVMGAKISAKIIEHGKADKVHVIKFKSKSRYRRNVGHRQPFTKIRIETIAA